jgi:general secretion pathway protein G
MTKKGFTLIELLVVIAIIGLLTTLSVASFNNAREKGRNTKRLTDIKRIQIALESYYNYLSVYPDQLGRTIAVYPQGIVYLQVVPSAPVPPDGNCTSEENTYTYKTDALKQTYELTYCLSGTNGGPKMVKPVDN